MSFPIVLLRMVWIPEKQGKPEQDQNWHRLGDRPEYAKFLRNVGKKRDKHKWYPPHRATSLTTDIPQLGARLRGRTATQRSKKGSEKVLGRVLGKGSQKGSEKGGCYRFYRRGSEKGVFRRCLERPLGEYAPLGVRPTQGGWRLGCS